MSVQYQAAQARYMCQGVERWFGDYRALRSHLEQCGKVVRTPKPEAVFLANLTMAEAEDTGYLFKEGIGMLKDSLNHHKEVIGRHHLELAEGLLFLSAARGPMGMSDGKLIELDMDFSGSKEAMDSLFSHMSALYME
jgi:hypothetical protein